MLDNGDVLFAIEMAVYLGYEPTLGQLASIRLPCAVAAGADNRHSTATGHWRYEVAQWLAGHLRTPLVELPGAHMAYLDQPRSFAAALRPLLARFT